MEQMQKDIEETVRKAFPAYRDFAESNAEYYAEVYVSSTLALDDDEVKQTVKNQYKELFMHQLSLLIFSNK